MKKIEFSVESFGKVNERLDKIQATCHNAFFGNARKAVMDIQLEVIALKKLILEQATERVD